MLRFPAIVECLITIEEFRLLSYFVYSICFVVIANRTQDSTARSFQEKVPYDETNYGDGLCEQLSAQTTMFRNLDQAIKKRNESDSPKSGRLATDSPSAPLSSAKNAELDRRRRFNDTTSISILFSFMASADERITWVEGRELWSGMFKTNNGKQSSLASTWRELKEKHAYVDELDGTLHCDNAAIARGIKVAYSIRLSNDHSEMKFIAFSLAFLWLVVSSLGIIGHVTKNTKIGTFSAAMFIGEAGVLFIVELIWETFLSWIVLRYNIKINYSRKLGNLLKVPKYFAADFLPFYESSALSMFTSLAVNQTLFCMIFYRTSRERVPYFSYVFLSQDRREDRPDTLLFQVTEDIMRFSIYFPFKIFVANYIEAPAIIFIPILINNIGDGLAEPVGVRFGRHKYTTTALYYKGKFWNGQFTRSYEGSACVYIVSLITVACNYHTFTLTQFCLTITLLPFLMTIAEARAPHTNDGPFLALIGCGFLSIVFFCVP